MNPLKQLESCGQAPWLDYLKRSLLENGDLERMIERDGLKGMTSNPSIFEKAIGASDEYAEAIRAFQASGDHGVMAIYEHLAIADIRAAADALRPVFEATAGRDGYISLECSPYVADDTEATVAEALRLWQAVDRPNLMVKVPATPAGVPAIRTLIGKGLNINITLLFAVEVYEQVVEAYLAGLEEFRRAGGDVGRVASVASFFISRIDSAVDKQLAALKDKAVAERLKGKIAIANAKVAYASYQALFSGPRWQALAAAGARTQRLLWASTSTKDPTYKDTLYVETLIGRDTVNTLPPATMDAYRDHGRIVPDAVEQDLAGARAELEALTRSGISLKAITDQLVVEGVQAFADSFDTLLATVAQRRRALLAGDSAAAGTGQEIRPGSDALKSALAKEMTAWRRDGGIRRLWSRDKGLWTGADEDRWLGWLDIADRERAAVAELEAFAGEVRRRGFSDVVLLGMGGSSLGPEVLAETLGPRPGWPRFHMLDSTDPGQVARLEKALGLARTLVIVASKSGSTLEPNIFMDFFLDRVARAGAGGKVGDQFVAVTDPGSSLEKVARDKGFAHVFHGVPSIGGRYSVLSRFGLVPAAAMGIDVRRLLDSTRAMELACGPDVPPEENPGVALGVALGVAARAGRDKVTIVASPPIAGLGAWLEQLLAESTGKHGHGLIPVDLEPPVAAGQYGSDRFFAYVELAGRADAGQRALIEAVEKAGHPVARIVVADVADIGQEFFRWEIATAVAGAVIGINPFDQPDVEASKVKTRALTTAYEKDRRLPAEEPIFRDNGIALHADPRNAAELGRHNTLDGYLRSHFARTGAGDYVALLAYLDRSPEILGRLEGLRRRLLERTGAATCVQFGPRFLHSTGQAYKGGPNSGVFLQITGDPASDLDVPGRSYSFGVVEAAQARGDMDVLVERGRRVLRVHLSDIERGLGDFLRAADAALQGR